MYVLVSTSGAYACALGLKNNVINAYKFKTKKEAAKFAKSKYTNYKIKEI